MRTDEVDGFMLDRGFQVLLTAYPEARRLLDYDALKLKAFESGALIRHAGKFHRLRDPWRQPSSALETALSPIGTALDKLRVGMLRMRLTGQQHSGDPADSQSGTARTTYQFLKEQGFSDAIINEFFRPFFGGIFLDKELSASSTFFEFLFDMFSAGSACVPARGMGEIPAQLSAKLPPETIRFHQRVKAVSGCNIVLESGKTVNARTIIIATEGPAAGAILQEADIPRAARPVTCIYFSTDNAPLQTRLLVLNGDESGVVNNLALMSTVAPDYAPRGKTLVSVSILGNLDHSDEDLNELARKQLRDWFGKTVDSWTHLRTYRIPHALPIAGQEDFTKRQQRLREGLYICGDYTDTASINGALKSGRLVAEMVSHTVVAI